MSKNVIFCYSGSGNCLDFAKNVAKGLGDTDIIMMRKAPVKTDVRDAERVRLLRFLEIYGRKGYSGNTSRIGFQDDSCPPC